MSEEAITHPSEYHSRLRMGMGRLTCDNDRAEYGGLQLHASEDEDLTAEVQEREEVREHGKVVHPVGKTHM